ncbi:MAG TPA: DinB family protein [Aquaticitalea sp.]|nr:DinB family protein [Aquaticitalea sp.]
MKEQERLVSLFGKLYDGEPWIDVNLVSTLNTISANQAHQRPLPNCNTIWEITNHIIAWRQNVLQRVNGELIKTPSNNYITSVEDTSEEAWKETLNKLAQSQDQWIRFLKQTKESDFELVYPNNHMTYYEHIQGVLQHDCYHLGQIVLLSKQF